MSEHVYGDGTRCVYAGLPAPRPGEPFLPGPVFAAPYHLDPVGGPAAAAPKPLTAWEAYAQALLLSNEFLFID